MSRKDVRHPLLPIPSADHRQVDHLQNVIEQTARRALDLYRFRPNLLLKKVEKQAWFSLASAGRRLARALAAGTLALGMISYPVVAVPLAQSMTYTVTTLKDSGPGSLRNAINQANGVDGPDTITFASTLTGTITLTSGPLYIVDSVDIQGPGSDALTISGNHQSSVITCYPINDPVGDPGTENITISGLTIQDGLTHGNGGGIFNTGFNLNLSDVVIDHNKADGNGGGIYSAEGDLALADVIVTSNVSEAEGFIGGGGISFYSYENNEVNFSIHDSVITNNQAIFTREVYDPTSGGETVTYGSYGGGIFILAYHAQVLFENVTITGNSAFKSGGGLFADYLDDLQLHETTISGNTSMEDGGGVSLYSPATTIEESEITGNYAKGSGGGFSACGSDVTLTRSTVSNNVSGYSGGGFSFCDTNAQIQNSTISGNTAGMDGGGIQVDIYSTLSIAGSTISSNLAGLSYQGGGIFNTFLSSVTAENTIIADNGIKSAGDDITPNDLAASSGSSFTITYSLIEAPGAVTGLDEGMGNILYEDPQLGSLQDNGGSTQTHAPALNSPVIDAGSPDPSGLPPTDQRGITRVMGSRVDMGAVEIHKKVFLPSLGK